MGGLGTTDLSQSPGTPGGYGLESVLTPEVKEKMENFDYSSIPTNEDLTQTAIDKRRLERQTQASDIQANPLPSLPSISNVGAVPFTGTVSSIPGGFQPLPQIVGGKKKLYQLSKFHGGMNQKSSPRDISDMECQKATNVTFSSVGRIILLGDCLNTNNSITTHAIAKADRNAAGYGLFQFTAPADWDGANAGNYVLTLSADGNRIDIYDPSEGTPAIANWMDFAGATGADDNHDVAQVLYAAGNGVYAADANFDNLTNLNIAKVYVYREEAGSLTSVGWKEGNPLINSPQYDIAAHGSMAAGDVKIEEALESGFPSVAGTAGAVCAPSGTGSWDGQYFFYISWLFDGGCETGLTSCATDDGTASADGIEFDNELLTLNVLLNHIPHASNNTELGGDKRIEGGRIYFKEAGTAERWLLAEFNLADGVKGALDSTFTPWSVSSNVFTHTGIIFDAPPSVYSYASLNTYYANELYTESDDDIATTTAGPTPHDVRYKTAVVGSGGIVFIGNVKFKGKHMPDSMMFSMQGKPGAFPQYNRFDSPSSDGSPITALAAYRDTILQFKENGMYVINVSNPAQFYAQASFRDCGVFNPCQVFTTSFGVIFANKNGCYIYDGQRVTSLTDGKFGFVSWDLPNTAGNTSGVEGSSIGADATGVPCVGYDPRSQSIIVLKDINDDSTSTGAFVYNMVTQSWTEGNDMITNANTNRHTNFIITSGGYLSILRDDNAVLENYNHDKSVDTGAQTITYQTKDLDFGTASQTKKLFKVYVTYTSGGSVPTATFGVDGGAVTTGFSSGSFSTSQTNAVATFVPTSAATGIKSFAIKIAGSTAGFEINDISILYRVRPIK